MNIVLWVIAGLLAFTFLAAGAMKLTQPKEKLAASGMGWTDAFSPRMVKTIGALEVLAAIGLILPGPLDTAPVLPPPPALGLVLMMSGPAAPPPRRNETQMIGVNVVLLILAAVVAWGRFGPYSF